MSRQHFLRMTGVVLLVLAPIVFFACGGSDDDKKNDTNTVTKEASLVLDPIEVDQSGAVDDDAADDTIATLAAPPEGIPCHQTTLTALLTEAGIGPADVNITDMNIQTIRARYLDAQWDGDQESAACEFELFGAPFPKILAGTIAVERGTVEFQDIEVSPEVREFVDYYFAHQDEEFTYCVATDEPPANFGATLEFIIGVKATAEPLS